MKEKYLYNYSFDEFVKTIKHYCNLLYLSKNLIVFKYMISILTILLLHTNNLYAQAKLTDTVSILRADINGCEDACRNSHVYVDHNKTHIKDINFRSNPNICPEGNSNPRCVFKGEICDGRCYLESEEPISYSVRLLDYSSGFFIVGSVQYYYVTCNLKGNSFRLNKVKELIKRKIVSCSMGRFYFEEGECSTILGNSEHEVTNKCKLQAETKLNKCISECRKQKDILMIGNKEIKTVGDLLDSIPATELLKVYDPNMVYQ